MIHTSPNGRTRSRVLHDAHNVNPRGVRRCAGAPTDRPSGLTRVYEVGQQSRGAERNGPKRRRDERNHLHDCFSGTGYSGRRGCLRAQTSPVHDLWPGVPQQ